MRILISLSYYTPNISGLTNYAKTLAQELVKRGHHVTVLTSRQENNLLSEEIIDGVRVIRVPVSLYVGKGPIMFLFPFYAAKWIKWAEVVNCHLPQFESSIIAFLTKVHRKKLVLTYQTDLAWGQGIILNLSKIFMLISHFISVALADVVVASNRNYAKSSWFLRIFSKKLIYIYPPIRLTSVNDLMLGSLKERFRLQKKQMIGVVARMSPEKGIEYLLEAVPYLINRFGSNFSIIIAGPPNPIGENKYLKKIEALLKKYNKYVRLVGKLSDEELRHFYKTLDVLVLPSVNTTEAFGMVQVEAMLNGVPVVSSNLPGVRVPIDVTGMGELAEPRNSQDLAINIVRVLKGKEKYVKKKEFIESIFSLNLTVFEYEKLFGSFNNISIGK